MNGIVVVGVGTSGMSTCCSIGAAVVVGAGALVVVVTAIVVVVTADVVEVVEVVRIVVDVVVLVLAGSVVVDVLVVVVVVDVVDVLVVVGAGPPPPPPPPDEAIVTAIDCGDPPRLVCALPAVSVIENDVAAVSVDVTVPPPAVAVDVAVIVHVVEFVWAMEIAEIFVKSKSVPSAVDRVEQVIASSPVMVKVIVADVAVAALRARVTVGAVASEIVTTVDCDVGLRLVCALPALSVIEKDAAAASVDVVAPLPSVAVDVAVMVHVVEFVCAMAMALMFVRSKSVPSTVDRVEQVMASLPVTVNVIVADVAVAALRANVSVGAEVSMTIALLRPNDPTAPGEGKVRVAELPAVSLIVEPFRASDDVAT
jgi:hypothetical protein